MPGLDRGLLLSSHETTLACDNNEQICGTEGRAMDVGGGGMAVAGVSMAAPAFTCPSAGLNGPLGDVNTAALRGITAGPLRNLVETLSDFSSAEILIALMLAAASGGRRKRDDSDVGMGLLIGLALAQRLSQSAGAGPSVPPPCEIGAASGGQLNAVA